MEEVVCVGLNCLAELCCWYTVLSWCGCIRAEREHIHTVRPEQLPQEKIVYVHQYIQVPAPRNGAPKDPPPLFI
jgi:hypothetical protein